MSKRLLSAQSQKTPRIYQIYRITRGKAGAKPTRKLPRAGRFSTLTEGFADVRNSLEDPVREVDFDLDVLHVGQLQAQQFVLRGELELGICLDPVFIQRPVSFKEPSFLLFPPQSVIRPVLLDICNKEAIFPPVKSGTRTRTKEVFTVWGFFFLLSWEGTMDPKNSNNPFWIQGTACVQ